MILGEGQILAQVREAYELATAQRPVGPILSRLFDRALLVGKRARTETAIARSAVSVSQAAVEQAAQALGSLAGATVLLIGAGKMGELAARALQQRGAARLIAANRSQARASALVSSAGGEAWSLERLPEALATADVVISSTASENYIVTRSLVAASLARRAGRPLVAIDIAVPRDIEPDVSELPGVSLYNVDDLRGRCSANLEQRRRESFRVEEIVESEVERFVRWCDERELAPTIRALVERGEQIRQDELARALQRLGPLSERDLNALNAMSKAIVQKMLHEPITRLKQRGAGLNGHHYAHAARELFGLPDDEAGLDRSLQAALD
jgi:glutamyl-tRNA reductase